MVLVDGLCEASGSVPVAFANFKYFQRLGLLDPAQKPGIVFESIVKPVFLRFETDQHSGRLAVVRDDDLLRLGLAKMPGQIVLDFGERNFLHLGIFELGEPGVASGLVTIAKTWTVVPVTSQNILIPNKFRNFRILLDGGVDAGIF